MPDHFRGFIQIYTGNGKGKTTAALGLALRAAGRGLRTYIGQFLKGRSTGELSAAEKLAPFITIEQFGRRGLIQMTEELEDEDLSRAHEGFRRCQEAMFSGQYRIIVLDEALVAVHLKLLAENDLLEFLNRKPDDVEIVLTGRYATPALIRKADLVTEMKEEKHYASKGVKARDGIER